jgi:hypothetical protein
MFGNWRAPVANGLHPAVAAGAFVRAMQTRDGTCHLARSAEVIFLRVMERYQQPSASRATLLMCLRRGCIWGVVSILPSEGPFSEIAAALDLEAP